MADKLKLDEMCEQIRGAVALRVAEGFDAPEQIVESVTEYLADEYDHDSNPRPFEMPGRGPKNLVTPTNALLPTRAGLSTVDVCSKLAPVAASRRSADALRSPA